MCGRACRFWLTIVTSIILILVAVATVTLSSITFADDNDHLTAFVAGFIAATMFVTEGIFGLVFAFKLNNRCWMINAHVLSIIGIVISAVWVVFFLLYYAVVSSNISECGVGCTSGETLPTGGLIPNIFGLIALVSSIILVVTSAPCVCCWKHEPLPVQVVQYTT